MLSWIRKFFTKESERGQQIINITKYYDAKKEKITYEYHLANDVRPLEYLIFLSYLTTDEALLEAVKEMKKNGNKDAMQQMEAALKLQELMTLIAQQNAAATTASPSTDKDKPLIKPSQGLQV